MALYQKSLRNIRAIVEHFLLNPAVADAFSRFLAAILYTLEFGMSEVLSPLRPQDNTAVFESLQARLREMLATRQTDMSFAPAVKIQVRPGPKMLDDAEAAASVGKVQAEAQRGADVSSVHGGLDPQRVAKLLGLLE